MKARHPAVVSYVAMALLQLAASTTVRVDTGSFLVIVATSALAGTVAAVAGARSLFVPVVVVELTLGVLIGPQVLDLAHVNAFTRFFADLGLGMLFFFAGYEIDLARIRGRPLRLGLLGWALSLALAYAIGGVLAALGIVPPRPSSGPARCRRWPVPSTACGCAGSPPSGAPPATRRGRRRWRRRPCRSG